MTGAVIGVDLGGTNTKAGVVSADGRVLGRASVPTPADSEAPAAVVAIGRAARGAAERAGVALPDLAGVGVGSPGTIDLSAGVVTFSPNLPRWRNVPLRDMVERELGLPCVLENDANAAALAEQWMGAGRGAGSLVLLTLGTGIGGGIVLDGRVWHGFGDVAGEIGHMSINPDGPPCGCGNRGCLEAYASATAMVRRMREAISAGTPTVLADHPDAITARAIHEAAVAGDEAARMNIEQTGRYLGVGVSSIMHVLNPEVIAFSGGVTAAGDMLMRPLLDEATRRTMEDSRRGVRVCFSELPEDAGVIGAARCFMLAR